MKGAVRGRSPSLRHVGDEQSVRGAVHYNGIVTANLARLRGTKPLHGWKGSTQINTYCNWESKT